VSGPFDLAILGSGFGGSLLAMVARRIGLRILLVERGAHPRFAIGESTSPLANLLLEELANEYDLPRLLPFTTYGPWKRAYPEVGVGLKRGFSFYQHQPGERFRDDEEHRRQLLVAASPNDEVADTHWYRPDFDQFLAREAQALGADYVDRTAITSAARIGRTWVLSGERAGEAVEYRARFLVDATGQRGALSRLLSLPEGSFPVLPPTQGLFSHFTGVPLFADVSGSPGEGAPYPPDAAALHHVFEGGWMWVLRFDSGIASAGFAVEDWLADELRLEEREGAWDRFLTRYPSIGDHLRGAIAILPFVYAPRLSYRCAEVVGPGWALLPSAAAFIDPLYSTGFPLTLLGIHRLGRQLGTLAKGEYGGLEAYAAATRRESETAALLVAASYATFGRFDSFAAVTMLYFVAASYSEMARRLERGHLANEFLVQNQPAFRAAFIRHCRAAVDGQPSSPESIAEDLAPFNIAGLCDPAKRSWYGVDLNDVVDGAAKLHASPREVRAFFDRMGW
jgi:FADH2 O2-dependent halogenase